MRMASSDEEANDSDEEVDDEVYDKEVDDGGRRTREKQSHDRFATLKPPASFLTRVIRSKPLHSHVSGTTFLLSLQ